MGGSEPFNFGDLPEDAEAVDEDDGPAAVWLPPEDRLWRHPSEVALHGHPQGAGPPGAPAPTRPARRDHRLAITAGVVGVAAVATAVVVVFTLTGSPGVGGNARTVATAQEASFVTVPAAAGVSAPLVVKMMSVLRPSLISIRSSRQGRTTHTTGIVLAGGDLAVTAASAVGDVTRVQIVTSSGQRRDVRVLGTDPHSGIAVLSTGGGLTPADFGNAVVAAGELAIAACLCGDAVAEAADPHTAASLGEIRQVGTAVTLAPGDGLVDTIEADMPLGPAPWGGVLLNAQGQVVGVLDARETTATGHTGVFVPAPLAVAVAQQLATAHKVEHGWLGITGTNVAGQGGAKITSIMTGSPAAAAGLRTGDVVEAVDSHAVDSLADLQASLYTTPPGTSVSVMLMRAGQDMMTTLTLAGSPTG
ncbi:MAG: S1C family serine protease [Acidimicrobiales bacterium]